MNHTVQPEIGYFSTDTYAVFSRLFGLRHEAGVHKKACDCWNSRNAFKVPRIFRVSHSEAIEGSLVHISDNG